MNQYDFVAIDFETANDYYDSACAIGIAAVSDFQIKKTFYSLIKPLGEFSVENISIHGITPEDVKDAPFLEELWPTISEYFGNYAILAHNAVFDISVLKRSYPYSEYISDFKYIDTISLCKDFVKGKKDLKSCAESLGVHLEHHHNALDDAIACAKIAICCIQQAGFKDLGSLCFSKPNVKIHNFSELNPMEKAFIHKPKPQYNHVKPSDIVQTVDCLDCSNPLYGKTVVFTGEMVMDRALAMQIAVNAGATVRSSVSKKTNYLIVGVQDKKIVGEDGMSTKEEKAHELNEKGVCHIDIIGEEDFLKLANKETMV